MVTSDKQPDKLIALDLDGTLTGPDGLISDENRAALDRARRAGAMVALSTGRPYVSADAVVHRLGLTEAPIIAFNGALIRRPGGGEVLLEKSVPAGVAAEVVEECARRRLHLHYYLGEVMYVTRMSHWARLYCRRAEMQAVPGGDLRRFSGESPLKLLIVDRPERIPPMAAEYAARWEGRLYVTTSMPEYLEFLSAEASKGKALEWLARFYGIPRERTMAAGDALNDLPLLQSAGYAVAMPQGEPALHEVADLIPSDHAVGVAEAIERFLAQR